MNTRVIVGQRVKDFLQTLAPEPRRKLWRGIKALAQDKGDLKQLDGNYALASSVRWAQTFSKAWTYWAINSGASP